MDLRRKAGRASSTPSGSRNRRACRPRLDGLEPRPLLATISVNAGQVVRAVNPNLLGVNLVEWDSNLNTSQTTQMVQAAGLKMFRFPGGSASDDFHFNAAPAYNGQGTDASIAGFIASVNGVGVATLDYGSGSPQEAAAFLAYLNAPVGNSTSIGMGGEWVDSSNTYQQVNWQTAGYWASLRASVPLSKDDGLNFLRINHAAPLNVHYWEVGNEEYGSWETDRHGQGTDPGSPHDPTTYVSFAKQFQTYASTISPGISLGIDAGGPTSDNNWVGNVLKQSVSQGVTVGFISDHNYVQGPGSESDSTLLLHTVSDPSNNANPGSPADWALRASGYQTLLSQDLGASGKNIELLATEFNSVYSNPGKQTTSLVNGLFVADSLGSLLETPYNGADVWDLRNYYDNSNNNSANLYGWRQSGDYGLLGSPNGSAPGSGSYVPYPTYFAEQLASKIVQTGGQVVQAASNDPNLSTYAVLEPNGHLDLLVINKSSAGSLTGQFQVSGFTPSSQAQTWQYGEAQDTAQSQTTDGHSALANASSTLALSGSSFSSSFPAYSMTVLDLSPSTIPPPTPGDAGFEAVPLGNGNFAYNPSGSSWTFSGSPGNGSGVSGNNSPFTSGNPNAPQGSQVAFLQGRSTITQSVAGWAAGSDTISFQAAQRGNHGTSLEDFEVLVDGNLVGTFQPSSTTYATFTTNPFPSTSGSHTVQFLGLDSAGGDNTVFLDAVTVATSTATPPSSPTPGDSGFEAIPIGPGTYAYNPSGSSWTFSGSPGNGSGVSGNNSPFTSGNPNAPQGSQVAFLQTNGTITQTFGSWQAGTYAISFQAAQRGNTSSSVEDFEILVDGNVVGTFQPSGSSYQTLTTGGFTVSSGSHTVEFLGLDSAGGDNTVFLDAVTVATSASPPASPTPGDSGFETIATGGGYLYNPSGSAWTFSGSPGNGSGLSGNNSAFTSGNPNAPQGVQVAFLQGNGTITQTLAGWTAGNDTISFDAALRGNSGGVEDFVVQVDGNVVGTFKPTSTSYQVFTTAKFTVTTGSHVIKLVGINTLGGDDTDFLDAISIASA